MQDFISLTIIVLTLLGLISWVIWRRSQQTPGERIPISRSPKTLAEIRRFADETRTKKVQRQQVVREGAPAQARVLALEETGVNEHDWDEDDDEPFDLQQARPHVRVLLSVQPDGAAAFDAEVIGFVTRDKLAELRSSQLVSVRYLPNEPARVELDY